MTARTGICVPFRILANRPCGIIRRSPMSRAGDGAHAASGRPSRKPRCPRFGSSPRPRRRRSCRLRGFPRRPGGRLQQPHVDDLVGHFLIDDQLVLGVDRDLDVVADSDARVGRHGAAVGIGQRYLVFAVRSSCRSMASYWPRFLLKASIFCARFFTARRPSSFPRRCPRRAARGNPPTARRPP